jgi:hypothetical protein
MYDYDFLSDIEQLDDSSSDNDENTNEQSAMYDAAMNELAKLMMLDARQAAGLLNMGVRDFKNCHDVMLEGRCDELGVITGSVAQRCTLSRRLIDEAEGSVVQQNMMQFVPLVNIFVQRKTNILAAKEYALDLYVEVRHALSERPNKGSVLQKLVEKVLLYA